MGLHYYNIGENKEPETIFRHIEQIDPDLFLSLSEADGTCDYQDTMREVSLRMPGEVVFIDIEDAATCESDEVFTRYYAKDGIGYHQRAVITFPPFDVETLLDHNS